MSQNSSPTVCLTFDFDAISVWLGSFAADTSTPLSRGGHEPPPFLSGQRLG